jgi:hypothetical protein
VTWVLLGVIYWGLASALVDIQVLSDRGLLGEEEAVFAAEIADRPRGLGHEMKARKWALLAHRPQFSFQS